MGYLLFRAEFAPKALGVLLALAGTVHLVGSTLLFVAPAARPSFEPAYALPVVAELALCVWLRTARGDGARWRGLGAER